eukprot:6214675-Pleurochrysis_carterae.AAC.1
MANAATACLVVEATVHTERQPSQTLFLVRCSALKSGYWLLRRHPGRIFVDCTLAISYVSAR